MATNASYIMCDHLGVWCYWHQGVSNLKTQADATEHCQSLGARGLVWWVAPDTRGCCATQHAMWCISFKQSMWAVGNTVWLMVFCHCSCQHLSRDL